ncbi:MAG TPA: ATP-binding protein, partial [Polyangia bacterium]|nr:ATP-binding protein [Polyangia bacterium]
ASVAHEINNPVQGVLTFSMLLQRMIEGGRIPEGRVEEFQRYLQLITDETARVGRIVSDLLSFSRRSRPQSTPVNLNSIIEHTVSLLAHSLELGNVQLEFELDPALPEIPCDKSQIQQVVINLVMNAAEAMPGGGRVTVGTGMSVERGMVQLEVADTGTGISEEIFSRIFDPFTSTKEEGKGVGLGLAVVYGIVDAHGGVIDVKTGQGRGTTFTVTLPIGGHGPARESASTVGSAPA